ncbi:MULTISPECIES: fatty acid desaturase family protein [Streptomyces]|uniref:Fatty acid desaturase n=1 Tax=Streptomyces albus (strain ATCC 21838 / DSM 41398 / FERM P-419 / JCM 4703 / NBRC 107858) TaxID=1081613 RepID=A0A0B5EVV8_STRA4|nr:acyl-CoA desaturase [Streptomyces sp. SCSIO ZS0520]AJE83340.1 fatty acid desaturase [Streptomyces albus]AOU77652.1 fatty acid desaturase [Streptomyces albus]AYN33418.1 acyl-CoA desaturase [Streptomyces albus]
MELSAAPPTSPPGTARPRRSGSPPPSAYTALSRQVKEAGLLRHRPVRGLALLSVTAALLAGGWCLFVLVGNSWWQLAVAPLLAFASTQCGFRGHEAGHRQTFRSKRLDDAVGLLFGNLFIGLGFGWWTNKHNRHHAHPNQVGRDPDIETGALVFDRDDATGRTGVLGFLTRHQAAFFFPLLLLEGWSLHVASVRALRTSHTSAPAPRAVEALLLLLHTAAYLAAVALVLPPLKALVFVLVQQGLFGLYLGVSFAPNHKGMELLRPKDRLDFLSSQVLTSRNVRGGPVTDFLLGGLNHQIEHHLFPNMPTSALPLAQPLVRARCAELGLPYTETSLVDSYRQALRHLRRAGAPAPATTGAPTPGTA